MSKKMKLELEELKVQSFVTSLEEDKLKEILGGDEPVKSKLDKICVDTLD